MRLFVAIPFDRETKDRLYKQVERLRVLAAGGNFPHRENLHLTLAFLGETDRFADAKAAVLSVMSNAFTLKIGGAGRFSRRGGDIRWIGVEAEDALLELQQKVAKALCGAGFPPEDRPYRPHLTIGRGVKTPPDFDEDAFAAAVPRLQTVAGEIVLMESHRVAGRLTYTPRVRRRLEEME